MANAETTPTPITPAEKLAHGNWLTGHITTYKRNLAALTDGKYLAVSEHSGRQMSNTENMATQFEGGKPFAAYDDGYDFVSAQTAPIARLAAVFVVESIKVFRASIAEAEAELAALFV